MREACTCSHSTLCSIPALLTTSRAAEVCQHEAFPWGLYLHQYSRLLFYLLQMDYNSFLSSFFGLFIFYFNPNNFCASCQTIYCITFFPSSDTISSLTQAGMFPPALLCLFLLQILISTLKAKPDLLISCCLPSQLHKVSLPHCGDKFPSPKPVQLPRRAGRDHHFNINFGR